MGCFGRNSQLFLSRGLRAGPPALKYILKKASKCQPIIAPGRDQSEHALEELASIHLRPHMLETYFSSGVVAPRRPARSIADFTSPFAIASSVNALMKGAPCSRSCGNAIAWRSSPQ